MSRGRFCAPWQQRAAIFIHYVRGAILRVYLKNIRSVDVHNLALKRELAEAQADWEAAPEWYQELPFLGHAACGAIGPEDPVDYSSPQSAEPDVQPPAN